MLSENREYHIIGKLNIKRSRVLDINCLPKDDNQNWLFLGVENKRFSFVYKIDKPDEANYSIPFQIKMAFTVDYDVIKKGVFINHSYEVLRGEESIGSAEIVEFTPKLPQVVP